MYTYTIILSENLVNRMIHPFRLEFNRRFVTNHSQQNNIDMMQNDTDTSIYDAEMEKLTLALPYFGML